MHTNGLFLKQTVLICNTQSLCNKSSKPHFMLLFYQILRPGENTRQVCFAPNLSYPFWSKSVFKNKFIFAIHSNFELYFSTEIRTCSSASKMCKGSSNLVKQTFATITYFRSSFMTTPCKILHKLLRPDGASSVAQLLRAPFT